MTATQFQQKIPLPPENAQYQLPVSALIEMALSNAEGILSESGALGVKTGAFTGRAANDRFIVKTPETEHKIAWGQTNQPVEATVFDAVYKKVMDHLSGKPYYVFNGFAGADKRYALPVQFITELASHSLFAHQMFIRPTEDELASFSPEFTLISAPTLELNPETDGTRSEVAIMLHLEKKLVLIAGTRYAGESKKSIFSVMNYLLPARNVMPMHCSVNVGADGQSAIFFGLSGTGKTTLSADASRGLIGDDEHGWSDDGIFNFEGGCYAKTIRLSKKNEPEIWHAIRYGALTENASLDPETRQYDFDDGSITENGRVAYPIHYIDNAVLTGQCGHPNAVIFLTADAFGVLPPIAKLTEEQAQYHFISGYTSKLAGTEIGITEPVATFSACFGEPFMPLPVSVYADLLVEKIRRHNVRVYLINTGWQGGAYGSGKRISIPHTRAMVNAALKNQLADVQYKPHPIFNVLVPQQCPGVPDEILDPKAQWQDPAAYDVAANTLADRFIQNFQRYTGVEPLAKSGPQISA
ncbi:MAG: phosphoenolpyruvate carboxykinase (ATP) [Cyanobacteria bacterium P01_H01_bin.74]